MESIEVSAKSVEDAVERALAKLGLERSQVQIEVLSQGRAGILGLGSEEARVKVTPLIIEVSPGPRAKETLEKILGLMDISAQVNLVENEEPAEESTIALNIEGEELGVLIGRRGETLVALQHLVNLMLSRQLKAGARVMVDVGGYRSRRQEALRALALRMAEQVKASGRSMVLEPMPANERRVIHMALRDNDDVTTRSLGEGDGRKVAIFLKKGLLTEEQ